MYTVHVEDKTRALGKEHSSRKKRGNFSTIKSDRISHVCQDKLSARQGTYEEKRRQIMGRRKHTTGELFLPDHLSVRISSLSLWRASDAR